MTKRQEANRRQIVAFLRDGQATPDEIARETGIDKQAVRHTLRSLRADDLAAPVARELPRPIPGMGRRPQYWMLNT